MHMNRCHTDCQLLKYFLFLSGEPHIDGDAGDLKFIIKEQR